LKLPPEEVISFRDHLFEWMNVAFRWELWGPANAPGVEEVFFEELSALPARAHEELTTSRGAFPGFGPGIMESGRLSGYPPSG
jgi:hypothetical protein